MTLSKTERWQKWVGIFGFGLTVAWLGYATFGSNLFGSRPFPESIVDYRILYEQSRKVVDLGFYPVWRIFLYPPSAVALFYFTALAPYRLAASLWLIVTFAAALGTLALGSSLVGLARHWSRWLVALAALALINYSVVWDLRSQNCNLICCFLLTASLLALHRKRAGLAGLLLAASVALKPYPILVLPYFLWIGRRRAFVAAVGFLFIFFGVVPLLVFRSHFFEAYVTWLDMLRHVRGAIAGAGYPTLISIPFALSNRLRLEPGTADWTERGALVIWLGATALAFAAGWRRFCKQPIAGWDLAVDGGVLALAPVMISPFFEAYHAVPALLIALALLRYWTVPEAKRPALVIPVALAIGAGLLALHISGRLGARGFGLYVQMLLLILAIALVRFRSVEALKR